MLLKTLAALFALAIGGVATAAVAISKERSRNQAHVLDANWVLLGTRSVDLKKDGDRFDVGASKGRFKSLMIVGVDRRIDIHRVTITTDGEPYVETQRLKLEQGQRSHPIRFNHDGGVVQRVDVAYRSHLGAGGPAKLELWGLRASPEVPSARSASPHWVWIGTRSVDLEKEEDHIDVGASKGRFKSLMIVGVDRVIDIRRVTVVTDGAPHVEKTRLKLQHGQRSRPITISREGLIVRRVDLSYRLHLGAAGPANVELWGMRASPTPAVAVPPPPSSGPPSAATTPTAATAVAAGGGGDGRCRRGPIWRSGARDGRRSGCLQIGPAIRKVCKTTAARARRRRADQRIARHLCGRRARYPHLRRRTRRRRKDGVAGLEGRPFHLADCTSFIPANHAAARAGWRFTASMRRAGLSPSGDRCFSAANDGWLYLGGQSPLFLSIRRGLGFETDVVSVARNRGFRSLRLDVKNRAITLNRIKVIFADDSSEVFAERQRVAGGSSFGPVELQSGRPVKQIEISHRSRIFDSAAEGSGYAFVEFWAK